MVAGGWDQKRFLRLLVTSAAYRQSSRVTSEALAADPAGALLLSLVQELLEHAGMEFTKHTAVRAALHRDLIQAGLLPADLGQDYDFLLDLRETADYGGVAEASLTSATKAIEKARAILAAIEPLLPDDAVGNA